MSDALYLGIISSFVSREPRLFIYVETHRWRSSSRSAQTSWSICSNNRDPPTSSVIGRGQLRARQSGVGCGGRVRGWGVGGQLLHPGCTRCSNWATPNGRTDFLQRLCEREWWWWEDVVRIFPLFMSMCCSQCCVIITQHFEAGKFISWPSSVIYSLLCECEYGGVVTDVMYIVYACVICVFGFGRAICHWCALFGHFVLFWCWRMEWWSRVKNWFKTLVNIAQLLLLKKRLMISSYHQRMEKYFKLHSYTDYTLYNYI